MSGVRRGSPHCRRHENWTPIILGNHDIEANLAELQEKLNEAMQKLSEHHRLVVTLHDVQGMSHEEIAKIMDCNVGTVRSRLFYARQQMQAYLTEYLK